MRAKIVSEIAAACLLAFPVSGAAQTCVEPPAGLVSWWPAEGTTVDVAGTNHGSMQGGASFGPGHVGSTFVLDGFDDHILVADDPSLNLERITIEAWVKTPGSDDFFIASKSGSTGIFGYEIGLHPSGVSRFLLNGGVGGSDVLGTSHINDGAYHHVAATYDGTRLSVYVDGVLETRHSAPTSISYEPGTGFLIGAREFGPLPGFWPGEIDELGVYSRALCSNEIEAIFGAGSSGKCFGGVMTDCSIFLGDFESGDTGMWSTAFP